MEHETIEKVDVKIRIDKEKKRNEKKDQYVVLTIDHLNEKVVRIDNDWDPKNPTYFDPSNPGSFKTPVNKGKNITWIGISDDGSVPIKIENIVMKNSSSKQILKSRSYIRRNEDVVVGKVKVKKIKDKDTEAYFLTYSVNENVHTIDPILEFHDR